MKSGPYNCKYFRPFLKWPGGKYRLLQHLQPQFPQASLLIEPFVGAGAIFLNTDYANNWLNDINADLIGLYMHLQKEGEIFIKEAKKFFSQKNNTPGRYYLLRDHFNQSNDTYEKALLFLFLNRFGFNGLCRYNNKGIYNVPFGKYKKPYFPEIELFRFLERSKQLQFFNVDYQEMMQKAANHTKEAVIYCDPPYVPLSKTANFTQYSGKIFDFTDQINLARLSEQLAKQGKTVIISNHDLPATRLLYQKAQIFSIKVSRVISAIAKKRILVPELIAVFHRH
ncbi:MAG TPA: Dam family site-specific DNA-(adenine-N6)-methyltransferase [Gammaproteobacteria bacterium]|nr:Dam family site-specific DNA-(adenine-N6)-methyltransferase [Gammaproteobacteria bacterium]